MLILAILGLVTILLGLFYWLELTRRQKRRGDAYIVQSEKRSTFSNLLSGLSHELNNPMTFIQSNLTPMRESVQKIETAFPQPDDTIRNTFEKLRRMIDHVEEGVRRSRSVIKSFNQFPNQKGEPKEAVDLQEILEGCLEVLSPKWKDHLQIQKNYGEISRIKGYRGELEQAFTNLLANAFDATPDQGMITITTKKGAGGVKVVIHDTGQGIPAEEMGKIFDPFFTTKEQGKGTGLGLAIALQLITNHKGTIQVKSKPGKGSEFTVFLPS